METTLYIAQQIISDMYHSYVRKTLTFTSKADADFFVWIENKSSSDDFSYRTSIWAVEEVVFGESPDRNSKEYKHFLKEKLEKLNKEMEKLEGTAAETEQAKKQLQAELAYYTSQ